MLLALRCAGWNPIPIARAGVELGVPTILRGQMTTLVEASAELRNGRSPLFLYNDSSDHEPWYRLARRLDVPLIDVRPYRLQRLPGIDRYLCRQRVLIQAVTVDRLAIELTQPTSGAGTAQRVQCLNFDAFVVELARTVGTVFLEAEAETHLVDDLGLDSSDFVEVALALEDNAGIRVEVDQLEGARTVGDLYRICAAACVGSTDRGLTAARSLQSLQ